MAHKFVNLKSLSSANIFFELRFISACGDKPINYQWFKLTICFCLWRMFSENARLSELVDTLRVESQHWKARYEASVCDVEQKNEVNNTIHMCIV